MVRKTSRTGTHQKIQKKQLSAKRSTVQNNKQYNTKRKKGETTIKETKMVLFNEVEKGMFAYGVTGKNHGIVGFVKKKSRNFACWNQVAAGVTG